MTRIVMALLVLGLLAAAPVRADVFDDNPGAASRGAGDVWLFARRTSDGAMLVRELANGSWSAWSSLGGNFTSGPAAAAYGPDIEVFARGQNGAIWGDSLHDGAWTGWTSLGGYSTSAPAAIARRGTSYLDVAMKGGDNAIYLDTYVPGKGWSGWGSVGGNLTTAPALDSHSDGILDIFARGTDGALHQQAWTGSQWLGWGSLSGGIVGAPAAVNREAHDLDMYVIGAGNALYRDHWDSVNSWSGWTLVDNTPVGSSVAAVSDNPAREMLFVRSGDEMGIKTWTNPGGWTGWSDFGPIAVPPPAPAPAPAPQGEVNLLTGIACTPVGGLLHVSIKVRKLKGRAKPRVVRITFFTRGKGRAVRVDRHAPFSVRIRINRPAGTTGRIYARVYFRRSARGALKHKLVFRRYRVCS